MGKYDLSSIVADVQKFYAKDSKSKAMIVTGDTIRQAFSETDGIPVPLTHPIHTMSGLPCIPFNRIIQIAGNADTGKSTMAGELIASAQKAGHLVVLWDSEDKFDANRLRTQFGGNPDDLVLIKTNEILQGGEKVRKVITAAKTKYPDVKILLVWDSVGGSQSRSHAERELDNEKSAQPGQDAKENASVMKMLVSLFNKYPDSISVCLANQVYAKIGFMQHGDRESGGKKVEFHSSLIIHLKRIKVLLKQVKGVKVKTGILTRATVTKNHLSQSDVSVYQMDFQITAAGTQVAETQDTAEEDEE